MLKKTAFYIFLILFFSNVNGNCFETKKSHRYLTNSAVKQSTLKEYLQRHLGFVKGIETRFPSDSGDSISDLLEKGAIEEDVPRCRAVNHFHDPLQPWGLSFMSDDTTLWGLAIRADCSLGGWPYSDRKSNVTWATGFLSPEGPRRSGRVYGSILPGDVKVPRGIKMAGGNYYPVHAGLSLRYRMLLGPAGLRAGCVGLGAGCMEGSGLFYKHFKIRYFEEC